jgi:hypothetical protein
MTPDAEGLVAQTDECLLGFTRVARMRQMVRVVVALPRMGGTACSPVDQVNSTEGRSGVTAS